MTMNNNNSSPWSYNPGALGAQDGSGFNPGGSIGGVLGSIFGGPLGGLAGSLAGSFLGQHGVSGPGGGISSGGGGGSDGFYAGAEGIYNIRTRGPDGSPTNTQDIKDVLSKRGTWKPKSPSKRKPQGPVRKTSIQEMEARLRREKQQYKKWKKGGKEFERKILRNNRLRDNANARYGVKARSMPSYTPYSSPFYNKNLERRFKLEGNAKKTNYAHDLRKTELFHDRSGRLTAKDNIARQRKNNYNIKKAKAKIRLYKKRGDTKNVARWRLEKSRLNVQNKSLKARLPYAVGGKGKRFPGPGEWQPGDDAIKIGANRSKKTKSKPKQQSRYRKKQQQSRSKRQAQQQRSRYQKSRQNQNQQQRSRYQKKRAQSRYQSQRSKYSRQQQQRKVNNRSKYSKPKSKYQSRSRVRNLKVNRRKPTRQYTKSRTVAKNRRSSPRRPTLRWQQQRNKNVRSRYTPRSRVRNLRVNKRKVTTRRYAWKRRR